MACYGMNNKASHRFAIEGLFSRWWYCLKRRWRLWESLAG